MAIPESYPPRDDQPSPAPPELPALPPASTRPFQFSLRSLLAYMFGAAILAALLRYPIQYLQQLPTNDWTAACQVFVVGLAFGALLYYFLRAPFLVESADRFGRRWRQLKRHRQELDNWSRQRRSAPQSESVPSEQSDSVPGKPSPPAK